MSEYEVHPDALAPTNGHGHTRSATIGKLASALAKAQGQIKGAVKDSENPFFKSRYADLASVWEACRKPLSDNSLAVLQLTKADNDGVTVTTILAHESGEWIEEALTLPLKEQTPQAVGSALTYGRRYGLSAMVGIAPEDDDGEAATAPIRALSGAAVISEPQANRLRSIAHQAGWKADELAKWLREAHQTDIAHITRQKYDAICKQVEQGAL